MKRNFLLVERTYMSRRKPVNAVARVNETLFMVSSKKQWEGK